MPADTLAAALFRPRAIALIGASADPAKNTSRAQRLLHRSGFGGRVLPINPGRAEVFGDTAYPDIRAAPGPIDHALIMVPAAAVMAAVEGCIEKGVPVATIYSAGFAETGDDGRALQDRLVAVARAGGLRLLGPNCLGLVNVTDGVPITNNAAVEAETLHPGPLGLMSQSGSMMGALLSRAGARGLAFAKIVSVGNECDLGVGEIAEIMVEDDATRLLLLFLETFRDAPSLARAARRAHVLGKPVIAYKLGRSDLGRRIAVSHTGAMVGGDELADAFFREHGILRVDTLDGLIELPRLVLGRGPPRSRRLAVMTSTGGGAAMVVDRLGSLGIAVVPPPPAMQGDFGLSDSPLIDLPMGGAPGAYARLFAALVASDHCDVVLGVLGSTSRLRPDHVNETILSAHDGQKPIAVFCAPQADAALRLCDAAGVAAFRSPETCADALHAYLTWHAPRPAPPAIDVAAAAAQIDGAVAFDEAQACALFATLGIEAAPSLVVTAPDEVRGTDGPCAVKLLSPDIPHKTEAGLVRLHVEGDAAIAEVVAGFLAKAGRDLPGARIRGVLVAAMQVGLAEVILGFRRDPEIGPVVMLGMGGVLAELRASHALRVAPVDLDTAREMIAAVPNLRMLQGFRNLPRGDIAALAETIVALSNLAFLPRVQDAEINPLIIRAEGQGVVAVDGLVTFTEGHVPP